MARTSNRPRSGSPLHLPGAFELWQPSKDLVLKNIWIFGPLYALPLIFGIHQWIWSPGPNQASHWWNHTSSFGSGWPGSPLPSFDTSIFIGFSLLWLIFVLVAGTIASVMTQAAQLDAIEHKPLDFQDLWKVVKELGLRMLGLYLVMGVLIGIGLLLLIVPGLILARRYFLAPYVMLEKKCSIREALDGSAALTGKNPGSIWGIFGVMFIISLIGAVPLIGGLASFIAGALYSIAPALRYQQLKKIGA